MFNQLSRRQRDDLAMTARKEHWARKAANPTYEEWLARYGAAERAVNVRSFISEVQPCKKSM